jgi:iron complex transport system ATP-binding protein
MTEGLVVTGLSVTRGGRTLVEDVSLVAALGSVTAILGPNGAGKSTLLKALAGLVPHSGEIAVCGRSMRGLRAEERARTMAYVPQRSELVAPLTVREVVGHARYAHGPRHGLRTADRDAVARALDRTDASVFADRSFATLSHGERQRVLVARALATGARVLLLDEPTSALDIGHALRLGELLRALRGEGYCVLLALHGLQEALDWTDDALLLDRGRLVVAQPTKTLFENGWVESIYGVRVRRDAGLAFGLDGSSGPSRRSP